MLSKPDACTVRDLLEMLISLPVYPNLRWRKRLDDGCHPCDLAREIYVDLAEELQRLYKERREALTKLDLSNENASKLLALLEHERETHAKKVAAFKKTASELHAMIAKQQKIINKETTDENTL